MDPDNFSQPILKNSEGTKPKNGNADFGQDTESDLLFTMSTKFPYSPEEHITTEDIIKIKSVNEKYMLIKRKGQSSGNTRIMRHNWSETGASEDNNDGDKSSKFYNTEEESNFGVVFGDKTNSGSMAFEVIKCSNEKKIVAHKMSS
jgi:hypothetical protein